MSSADSWRVDTDDRRRWWEVGRLGRDALAIKGGDSGAEEEREGDEEDRGKEEIDLFRERDRP